MFSQTSNKSNIYIDALSPNDLHQTWIQWRNGTDQENIARQLDNGYSKKVIYAQIVKKIAQFSTLKRFGPEKGPVYLRVLWITKPSTNLEKEVKTAVKSCYGSVSIRLAFTSKRMLPIARKDVLLTTQKSFVIYEYKCH